MSRMPWPMATLALVALVAAGCSSKPDNSSTGNTTSATHQKAMTFAACMRDNGVSKFPDPDASGSLTIDEVANGSSLDTDSASWKRAIGACKDLEPAGFTGHKRSAQQQKGALTFAQCMRHNGLKDFPDPGPDDPLIDTNRIPSMAGKDARTDPALQGAIQKCRGRMASAGVTGP